MSAPRTWLVLGHYGGHNTGDEAMLAGLVLGCAPALRRRLVVVTRDGTLPGVIAREGVQAVPAAWGPFGRAFARCGGIVLGGGSQFQDDYAGLRYVRHVRYMARFVLLSLLARALGKRVLWLGMGFGPFFRAPTRWLTRLGLAACHGVTSREATSARAIAGWIAPARTAQAFDLAALLAADIPPPARPPRPPAAPQVLGVSVLSVRPLLTGGAQTDALFWERLGEALARALVAHPRLRIHIFVIRGGAREADFALSAQLYRRLIDAAPARVAIIPHCADPTQTVRLMHGCDAFLATRFHAGVLAYLAGCRLAVILYHRKLADLAHAIGLGAAAQIPLRADTGEAALSAHIDALLGGDPAYQPTLPVAAAVDSARTHVALLERER